MAADTRKIQRINRSHFGKLFSPKSENLEEMDDFLDGYHLQNLNQSQINNLNRPIAPKKIEAVTESLFPHHKSLEPDGLDTEFY